MIMASAKKENEITAKIRDRFPEAVLEASVQRKGRVLITIKKIITNL